MPWKRPDKANAWIAEKKLFFRYTHNLSGKRKGEKVLHTRTAQRHSQQKRPAAF